MTLRSALTALTLGVGTFAAALFAAAPASAGGIVVIASPSHDNSCLNLGSAKAASSLKRAAGTVSNLLGQVPVASPLNHCGGADAPLLPDLFGGDQVNEDRPQVAGGDKFFP